MKFSIKYLFPVNVTNGKLHFSFRVEHSSDNVSAMLGFFSLVFMKWNYSFVHARYLFYKGK